ncbi:NADH:flavin oxidoreductase/NADH oxidase family protein [Candidatus Uabimicrobium sp. HlEnr_7]|uniref:NADH:flavin oxidoreductase/NADH oxidase family protein n=1 Tax=Candidatus Uabimicrobium helgolandensis TaxID=3095367 RepID=UPI0035560101
MSTQKTKLNDTLVLPNGSTLINRIGKSAMSESLADHYHNPTRELIYLYEKFAQGQTGLLITGNVMVDYKSLERARNIVFGEYSNHEKLKEWAQSSQQDGVQTWVQISHPGRQVAKHINNKPVAPSDIAAVQKLKAFANARALTTEEIANIKHKFIEAALTARNAGFQGVQFHAAHGYLLGQFLSPANNLRTDEWGGSIENRARLLIEIIRATREKVGPTFSIGIKINSSDFRRGGFTEEHSLETMILLDKESLDLIEISGGTYESSAMLEGNPKAGEKAFFVSFAERARQATKIPLMITGGFRHREQMEKTLESGNIDVIGLGRPVACDPFVSKKLLNGELQELKAPKIKVSKGLRGLGEAAWYTQQLYRHSKGQEAKENIAILPCLFKHFTSDFIRAKTRKVKK